jgi:hypothetical protein
MPPCQKRGDEGIIEPDLATAHSTILKREALAMKPKKPQTVSGLRASETRFSFKAQAIALSGLEQKHKVTV